MTPENVARAIALAKERLRLNPHLHDSLHTLAERALLAEHARANELEDECQKAERLWHSEAIRAENAETRAGGLQRAGEILLARAELAEHQLITCGVAATHPDAGLTLTGAYKEWDSPQAENVRKLRATAGNAECVFSAELRLRINEYADLDGEDDSATGFSDNRVEHGNDVV